jgi:tRNA dimethylallyltransferase
MGRPAQSVDAENAAAPVARVTRAARVVVIAGPTAAGKSRLAARIAPLCGAEIVCADSRQVYRYLDIGTGKPTPTERAAVPHHLVDLVDPDEPFDAAEFARLARETIEGVGARGRPVVLCGGSGLYIKALLRGLFPGPKADPALRRRLAGVAVAGGPAAIHRRLAECDPETAARLHPHDTVRAIRAIEVFELTGRPISQWQRDHGFVPATYPALTIGLWRERDALRAAIASRCAQMMADGLVEEVRGLWARGFGPELRPLRSLGYRHVGAYLGGQQSLDEALADMVADTCAYAKRQLTWFRSDPDIRWYHASGDEDAAVAAAERFVDSGQA